MFVKLSVGDGIVTQVPALIVSLAAGLIVTRGGTLGSTDTAVIKQLSGYPKALSVASGLMFILSLVPGLPFLPFVSLGAGLALGAWFIPRQMQRDKDVAQAEEDQKVADANQAESETVKSVLRTTEIELALGKQVSPRLLGAHQELGFRVGKMRKKFAAQYGFVVPEIKVTDDSPFPTNPTRSDPWNDGRSNTLRVG